MISGTFKSAYLSGSSSRSHAGLMLAAESFGKQRSWNRRESRMNRTARRPSKELQGSHRERPFRETKGSTPLPGHRLARAKVAFTIRHVRLEAIRRLLTGDLKPLCGDLVLARVEEIGHHDRLELTTGRRAILFEGDEIVVSFGNRYAPDQFEAEIPDDLSSCDLAAAGGLAARVRSWNETVVRPTRIRPLGLLADGLGRRSNLSQWALPEPPPTQPRPPTVAVVGTAMNAGKTTTAASLVRGLTAAGRRVGAAKVTGTGAGGDLWHMGDAGASPVLDFTHAGYPSTYRVPIHDVVRVFRTLTAHLAAAGADAIVLEVADGLYQEETAGLLRSSAFRDGVDGIVFAATDALGCAAGISWLQQAGLPVVAAGGLLTRSPLATREAAKVTGLPITDILTLRDPGHATELLGSAVRNGSAR